MSPTRHTPDAARGALAAAACYFTWGVFPLYWRQLAAVDATELIAHRHVASLIFILILLRFGPGWGALGMAMKSRAALGYHIISGALLTANWLVFVWAVNHGHVIETSLGYFLVPLVNVGLGRFVLHERLRRAQWIAIGCAASGVGVLLVRVGHLPWIALSLAATFGAYGFIRKKSPLGPLVGLGMETLLLSPIAVAFLLWRQQAGLGALGRVDGATHALLLSAGVITAVPLILFAYGARRIRFSTLGLLQYIAPTVQFSIGAWVYHEPVSADRLISFVLIWTGLVIYTVDNLWHQPRVATD